jgi:cell division transport system permease protein
LSAVLPNAKLDDHESWTRIPVRIAQTGEVFGLSLFSAIILTALSTIAAAARARLAINRSEIELLHTLGASDGYIARQFQTDPFRSAAVGSLIGAAISATIIVIAGRVDLSIAPMIVAFLLAVPIGATLLATLVARMTAYSLARRLP